MFGIGHKFDYLGKRCQITGFTKTAILFETTDGRKSQIEFSIFEREVKNDRATTVEDSE